MNDIQRNLFLRRVLAYLADVAILFALLGPAGFLVQQAIGYSPSSGPEIWGVLILNFSIPVWIYFWLSDTSARGSTLGKRIFRIRVVADGKALGPGRALARTALKLLPWELAHLSAFALSSDLESLSIVQSVGLVIANLLMLVYLWSAFASRGRRSVHDILVHTKTVGAD
ncbi:MAG TPA: RDD family protein [Wenzhouxiangellaceae bacterium]|nr:RDD family protein [Wenzhouxiangellaceae bacterium]